MKKVFMALTLCLVSIVCFSQQSFKGVSMSENSDEFVKRLTDDGLKLLSQDELQNCIIYTLKGTFASYNECEIFVYALNDKSCIYKVIVYLPKETSWYSLKNQFLKMKDAYTNKYGNYLSYYHSFTSPYYEGDGFEMTAVAVEKCNYFVMWDLQYGDMAINISKYKQVKITYEDSANFEKLEKINNENISNDI